MFTSSVTSIRKYTMSLLDKIDILITPNAYKKGKLFAALPSPTFGGELAVDGDFADGSTAWTLNPGWSIGGNSARYDGNALGTSIAQNISGVTGGNRYTVTFEVTQNTGDQNNTISLGSTTLTNSTHLPLGCNTFTGVAGFGTALNIYGNSGELLIIRNLTVKQELTGIADLDFTRATAATRVDPLGFINYAGVLPGVEQVTNGNFQQIGPEQVSNGDFDQTGPEEVSNGDFSQIGPEEVSNGDFSQEGPEFIDNTNFATDTDWGGSYSINTVTQQLTKTSSGLAYQINGGITAGTPYKIVVDVASLDGATTVWVAGNNYNLSLGIQTIYATGGTNSWNGGRIAINNGYASGAGSVLNSISVKEVGQGWSNLDSAATFSNNSVTLNNVSGNNRIRQNSVTNAGTTYKVTYEITDTDAAVLKYFNGSTYVEITSTIGTHTFYYARVGTNNAWYFNLQGGNYVTINSVSVKEVGQDWSFVNGATIGDDKANIIGDGSTAGYVSQTSNNFTSGKTYKISLDAVITSGLGLNVKFSLGYSDVIGSILTSGTYTFYYTASIDSPITFQRKSGGVAYNMSVTNISVKEVGQDWTFGTGWSLGNGYAESDGTNAPLDQYNALEIGKQYIVVITVTGMTASPLSVRLGTSSSDQVLQITSDGTYTAYGTAGSTTFRLRSQGFNGKVTNVSVKEVFQGWTIGTGSGAPELSLGSVTFTSNSQILFQPWTEETGTTYYIQLEGEGNVRLRTGFTGIPAQIIDVTLPDIITVNTDADTNRIQIYGPNTGTAVLTNVSVVEGGEIDIPRIDYTGGGCPHILVEPQRTNLLTYSEDFSSYNQVSGTITPDSTTSPDGTLNGSVFNALVGLPNFYTRFAATVGLSYAQSIFLKKGTRNWVTFVKSGGSGFAAWFDLENGVIGTVASGFSANMENYGNGWYRCSVISNATITLPYFQVVVVDNNDSTTNSVAGTIFIWGTQAEQGSYATSYIPTEGTTATRAIETYESAEDISGLINDSEGVLFSEVYFEQTGLTNGLFAISDGTFNNILMVRYSPINKLQIESTGGVNIIESSARPSGTYKIAVKYDSNGVELWVDGNKIIETSTQSTMSGINELMIGKSPYGNIVGCKIKQLQVYDTALTDEELTLLTIPPNSTYSTYAEMANALNYTLQ